MRVSEREIDGVPAGNLRVPLRDFGVLWRFATDLVAAQGQRGITDWPAGGVAVTCRWLARGVSVTANERRLPTPAPVTRRRVLASEETIEAEYLAAETMLARTPPASLFASQPGYVEAVAATLRWAWRASGPMPVLAPIQSG